MKIVISGERAEGKTTLGVLISAFLTARGFIVRPSRHIQEFTPADDTPTTINPRIVEIIEAANDMETWDGNLTVKPWEISP